MVKEDGYLKDLANTLKKHLIKNSSNNLTNWSGQKYNLVWSQKCSLL